MPTGSEVVATPVVAASSSTVIPTVAPTVAPALPLPSSNLAPSAPRFETENTEDTSSVSIALPTVAAPAPESLAGYAWRCVGNVCGWVGQNFLETAEAMANSRVGQSEDDGMPRSIFDVTYD